MHEHFAAKLEKVLNEALSEIPLRRAPSTLELRVLGELQRRAALPWWRFSFAHWPAAPRIAFVLVCVALIGSTFLGGAVAAVGARSVAEIGAALLSWAQPVLMIMSSAGGLAAWLVRVIPPLWLYAGMAVGTLLYVTLFGLGAAAYRTLYLRPSMTGDSL